MTKQRWEALQPQLDTVLDLPEEERAAWLDRLRIDAPTDAADLEALLVAESHLTEDLLGARPDDEFDRTVGLAGQTVGPYTLESPIGEGGMGTVWLGSRSDGRFEGKVAIKLLRMALLGRAGEERFRQEATVLARLSHPNIARLLDAGVTPAGQPYLVLEYVDGRRIDRFVDDHRYPPGRRIELFLDLLSAVASAHANLIVHRDIKPSNVMVTNEGVPKLLDFGIAKMLNEGRGAGSPATQTTQGDRALTPEFAAPEQIRGEPVTVATDVYSLGVLLYLLLGGRHPTGEGCRTPVEHLRAVVDTEPSRLSDVVTASGGDAPADREDNAASRNMTPERLRKLYLGDLDNILAKALKKHPSERYPTVTALQDDLIRYLTHQPVSARPDSWGYRARKFVRRNRTVVLAASVAALSLISGTGFAFRQMRIAVRQRDQAELARRRTNASVAFEFLMFRLIGPDSGPITYQDLLNRGRTALEKQYRKDPVAAIQLASQFAYNYGRTGLLDTSKAILTKALRTADSIGDPGLKAMMRCRIAYIDAQTHRLDSAAVAIARARIELRSVPKENEEPTEACDLAEAYLHLGRVQGDSAIPLFRAIAARYVAHGDTLAGEYVETLNELAYAMLFARRTRGALSVYQRLIERSRDGQVADPEMFRTVVFNAAMTLGRLGEFREQLALLHRELVGAESADSAAPQGAGLLAYGYAGAFYQLRQYDSAAVWYRRALDGAASLDPDFLALALGRLEIMARHAGREEAARSYHVRAAALDPAVRVSGEAQNIRALAGIEAAQGLDSTQALAIIRARLDSLNYKPNATWETLVEPLLVASALLNRLGAYETAARYAADVVRITTLDSLTSTRSGLVGTGLVAQARAELGRGHMARARDLVARAIPPLRSAFGPDHPAALAAAAFSDSIAR